MGFQEKDDDLEIVDHPDNLSRVDEDDDESESEDSESEDEEGNTPKKVKKTTKEIKRRFTEIIEALKDERASGSGQLICEGYDLKTSAGVKRFVDENASYLSQRTSEGQGGQTLLHFIANEDKSGMPIKSMAGLIKALVELPAADLLAVQDEHGKTPLFWAVTKRNRTLVTLMCDAHPKVSDVLKITHSRNNCIHEAILKKSSSRDDETIKYLISKADDDCLLALNEEGFTPLHLAVQHKFCDEGQLQIIEALVQKCERSLDVRYRHPEAGRLSPYRYLEYSQRQADRNVPDRTVQKIEKSKNEETAPLNGMDGKFIDGKFIPGKKSEKSREGQLKERPFQSSASTQHPDTSKPGLKYDKVTVPSANITDGINKKSETTAGVKKDKVTSSRKSKKLQVTVESVEKIKKFLRLYYLRSNKAHDDAIEFLYGAQQSKQIYFDLVGTAPHVNQAHTEAGLRHLAFEDVLQYVAIPAIDMEVVNKPGRKKQVDYRGGRGRSDLEWLFNWLRSVKKVSIILKVIVEDLREPAHRDEAIENCLTGMGVEEWDWRKRDLSPDVLQRVAPNAHTVHLYWSGNNAILRAWSEPDGLHQLPQLELIHLHWQDGLESSDRTRRNIDKFKERMKSGSRSIHVDDFRLGGDRSDISPKEPDTVPDPYERHRWIKCMEDYATFLRSAEAAVETDDGSPDGQLQPISLIKHRITVAIIDDGIDYNDPMVRSRVTGGRSFCSRDTQQNLNGSYYVSRGGHGTAMAKLICKICPNADLFILRLDEFMSPSGQRQITAKSAVKAVNAAVAQGVDIISMSWTIEKTDRNSNDIDELKEAISQAAKKNILMFCSAADQGAYPDEAFPAATNITSIFKIGAAEASGTVIKQVHQPQVDFIFPGHQVVMDQEDDPKVRKYTALTGSSVATALASGLAAVILYTVQLADVWNQVDSLKNYKSLKDHESMKTAFTQIGTTSVSDNKYIAVWNRFANIVKEANSQEFQRDQWIEKYIPELAKELLRKS
ncbi:hypothetical protein F5Y16DRAFT_377936 [Xylariaceae sp. FL0255]|nr:hypothetical protein F5Y16DRAFT_377936 [Xylariaceae sp. FL0255]